MRIALATDIYLPQVSGVADSVDLLARTLLGRGHAVRIYAPDLPDAEPDVTVFRRPAWAVPGSGGGLAVVSPFGVLADLRRFVPDVVHTHSSSTLGLAAMFAARRLGVPLVGTDHTFPADYLHYIGLDCPPFRFVARKSAALYYNRCAYVTTPSRSLLSELEDFGLARPAAVVSNHVPSRIFRPLPGRAELKARLGLRGPTVLLFGRIAVEKNLDVALEVFARVCGQIDVELAVVGDGPYRATLEFEGSRPRPRRSSADVRRPAWLAARRGDQRLRHLSHHQSVGNPVHDHAPGHGLRPAGGRRPGRGAGRIRRGRQDRLSRRSERAAGLPSADPRPIS